MPKAPQRCSPTCSNIKGKCSDHKPQRVAWKDSTRKDSGYLDSVKWKRQRRRVLFRDGNTCRLCGASDAQHVDHIIPVWYTRRDEVTDDELQTLCESCHQKKSSYEGVQAKRIKRLNQDGSFRRKED
jgi:5-methylcytosine-specific restriction enzyme A